jgi:hypothetical protein
MQNFPMTETYVDIDVALVGGGVDVHLDVPCLREQTGEKTCESLSNRWRHLGLDV